MRIVYLNPNATGSMTEAVVASARMALPGAEITGRTNHGGPPAIEGAADGAATLPGLMRLLEAAQAESPDAVVIACFDDTGLEDLRAAADCPVLGIGQAAYHAAALLAPPFGVVTSVEASVPVIEGNLAATGLGAASAGVRASGLPVLTIDEGAAETLDRIAAVAGTLTAAGAASIVLGCAGMSAHLPGLAARIGVPLVDGVRASARLAAALAG